MIRKLLFWQPSIDCYRLLSQHRYGQSFLVATNYLIWFFLFFVSYLLIKQNTNVFWQLLLATITSEVIEKIVKVKNLWKRPAFANGNQIPNGFIKSWYLKGSFPSGHTIKAVFFLLFILQYSVISPFVYLAVVVPLLLIRVICGFHYPVDILGGGIIGGLIWVMFNHIYAPEWLNQIISQIFNFVFFIK